MAKITEEAVFTLYRILKKYTHRRYTGWALKLSANPQMDVKGT